MWSTQNQNEFGKALDQLVKDEGRDYACGYFHSLAVTMLKDLPKRKQKELLKQIEQHNANKMVEVTNLMTGEKVLQPRNTPRCCDVSSELYWSM